MVLLYVCLSIIVRDDLLLGSNLFSCIKLTFSLLDHYDLREITENFAIRQAHYMLGLALLQTRICWSQKAAEGMKCFLIWIVLEKVYSQLPLMFCLSS